MRDASIHICLCVSHLLEEECFKKSESEELTVLVMNGMKIHFLQHLSSFFWLCMLDSPVFSYYKSSLPLQLHEGIMTSLIEHQFYVVFLLYLLLSLSRMSPSFSSFSSFENSHQSFSQNNSSKVSSFSFFQY